MIGALLAVALQHWLFVSDIHLNPYSQAGIVRGADTTPVLWRATLAQMKRIEPDPSVVLVGGDLLAHHFRTLSARAHVEAETGALSTTRAIVAGLNGLYPRAQFLVTLGNNDDPCGDYRSEGTGRFERTLARIWAPLVDRHGSAPAFVEQFARGGYYDVRLPYGERGIVLNSIFWSLLYRGGCLSHPRDPGGTELSWLRSQLRALPTGEKALLLMHVPPGYDPEGTMIARRIIGVPFLRPGSNAALLRLIGAHRASLPWIAAAHTHRYDFRIANGVPVLIVSSVSPVYNNNPAFYVLSVDARGRLHDIAPYVYDLRSGTWVAEPHFDAMYGVASFDRRSLEKIAAQIRSTPAVRAIWKRAYDVWSWRVGDLDADWRPFACAQTQLGPGYNRCARTHLRDHRAAILAVLLGGAAAIAVALLWLRRKRRR